MKEITLESKIRVCQKDELPDDERNLVELAIEATANSYAPHSHFHVGAALLLANGKIVKGCNQENAVLPAGVCAERSAIFSAGAQYPDQAVTKLAIAARAGDGKLTELPVSPCGICRQVMVETETRFQQPMRILLYGETGVYVIDGIKELMPLAFTEF
ncbi:MAG: cytidine deaminase [Prevotella sp.]|uniref:cytidine deaminase n=1 Tax=Prevotella sp. E13-27 TaxID=2938122 RepID=UPI00200A073E|nr:cytidine deaminase [Prevotella sp. E13-27]MBR4565507.1 cytidine deaminase [Prevotella sp.]MCK8623819.1 cytidine deaminase [Prevotella sp. E13-27]